MPRGDKFSLAAALFGWPPAPGHAAPDQLAPDSWLVLFREQHATPDPAVLSGLFGSCTSGRDWVYEAAPKVTLTLNTTAQQAPAEWLCRAAAVRQLLGACTRQIRLAVYCSDTLHSAASVAAVASLVYGLDTPVTSLSVRADDVDDVGRPCPSVTGLLHAIAPALSPHLTTLSLDPCPCALPPPDHLPQVHTLHVAVQDEHGWPDSLLETVFQSIAPYLVQLRALRIEEHCCHGVDRPLPWLALTPAAPTHTLVSLHVEADLCDEALALMTGHMPALQTVRATWLAELGVDHSSTQWGVRELEIEDCNGNERYLSRLPKCKEDASLVFTTGIVNFEAHIEEGLPADLVDRLSDWRTECHRLYIEPHRDLPAISHPIALRHTLSQVCERLQVTSAEPVTLSGWQWTQDMAQRYVQAIAVMKERGLDRHKLTVMEPVTDELLPLLIEIGPHVCEIDLLSLSLQSDTHVNTPWPWEQLTIPSFDITQLAKLPNPSGQGASRRVSCQEVMINACPSEVAACVCERLRAIGIQCQSVCRDVDVTIQWPGTNTCQALSQQFTLMNAIDPSSMRYLSVKLESWLMSERAMEALRQLPQSLPASLHFSDCTWHLARTEYARLAEVIPACFDTWILGTVSSELLSSIIAGINVRGSSTVTLVVRAMWVPDQRIGEHVIVSWRPWV